MASGSRSCGGPKPSYLAVIAAAAASASASSVTMTVAARNSTAARSTHFSPLSTRNEQRPSCRMRATFFAFGGVER